VIRLDRVTPGMRSHFAYCDQRLPYAPGASPFHIKGEYYRQTADVVAYHEKKTQGALIPILEREGLREFVHQPFLSSAFYDLMPMPRIVMAVAEARGRDVHELTSRMGQAAVEAQMKGVYARLLNQLTPKNFTQRFDQVINLFYDFAPVTVTAIDAGARVVRRGMPLGIGEWWAVVTVPFVVVPLTAGGARDVTVDWRLEPSGEQQGVPVGAAILDVRWAAD
jgi:hypothetical protein